ncbi:hypothetical protein A2368_02140 [Candidatus Collierbacteria bacterium RIFOXYB1_FULL_49_13]|uniref:Transcription elongation factor GreA/GreB N-terminal domain-containing protein n=1 Tax=Candidatus Collierbacteria bacterium RIFOXYB1_FULL_49_13 TaxID=1817728 RepID=A0A1F5FGC5_9BACT|nr:MAG: hypothetical protein A2368_02140 [Candidatus Collierbacteria bacterium RIFOXYB1_FULL_49_13]
MDKINKIRESLRVAEAEMKRWNKAIGEAAGTNSDWHDNAGYDYACAQFELYQSLVSQLKLELQAALQQPKKIK